MYYHTLFIHLFRPFLNVDLTNSKVSPRDICTSSANSVASLVSTYRQTYGFRRVPILTTHITLTSSIIHLLDLPNPSSARNLILVLTSLREMATAHAFASRCVQIIMALARQWNINLPAEVSQAAYHTVSEPMLSMPDGMSSSQTPDSYLSPSSDLAQHQDHIHRRDIVNETPFASVQNSLHPFSNPADLFWSPFPDRTAPLQAHDQGGPMDISAMLDVPNNGADQLTRDGFRVASIYDPSMGPPVYRHVNPHWSQA